MTSRLLIITSVCLVNALPLHAQQSLLVSPEFNVSADAHAGVGFMIFTTTGLDPILQKHYEETRLGLDAGMSLQFRLSNNFRLGVSGSYFSSGHTTDGVAITVNNKTSKVTYSGELTDELEVIFGGVSGVYRLADQGSIKFDVVYSLGATFFTNNGIFIVDTFRVRANSFAYQFGFNVDINLSEHMSMIMGLSYMNSVAHTVDFRNYTGKLPQLAVDSWDLRRFNLGVGLRYYFWKRKEGRSRPGRTPDPDDDYVPDRFK